VYPDEFEAEWVGFDDTGVTWAVEEIGCVIECFSGAEAGSGDGKSWRIGGCAGGETAFSFSPPSLECSGTVSDCFPTTFCMKDKEELGREVAAGMDVGLSGTTEFADGRGPLICE
jgi:hypothetical protein